MITVIKWINNQSKKKFKKKVVDVNIRNKK